jgi:hypothetical protein
MLGAWCTWEAAVHRHAAAHHASATPPACGCAGACLAQAKPHEAKPHEHLLHSQQPAACRPDQLSVQAAQRPGYLASSSACCACSGSDTQLSKAHAGLARLALSARTPVVLLQVAGAAEGRSDELQPCQACHGPASAGRLQQTGPILCETSSKGLKPLE